jgi:Protein of unknown function (DUF3307)
MSVIQILLLIAALQLKHFTCDGPLQTKAMVVSKSHYGQAQGVLHAFLHGIGSVILFGLFGVPIVTSLVLSLLDIVLHYHIDYIKENIVKLFRWSTEDPYFWWAISADQMLHQFTYLVMVGFAITTA